MYFSWYAKVHLICTQCLKKVNSTHSKQIVHFMFDFRDEVCNLVQVLLYFWNSKASKLSIHFAVHFYKYYIMS